MKTITQIPENYHGTPGRTRSSARGIIVEGNKILLIHELFDGTYLSPGGGIENNETLEECCKREMLEETGYIVEVGEHFLKIDEYFEDTLYIGNYFICTIIDKGEISLTPTEKYKNAIPQWVEITEALEIFKTFKGLAKIDDGKISLYKREYTVLSEYIKEKMNHSQ